MANVERRAPMARAAGEEVVRRLNTKFTDFRQAVETGKTGVEQDHQNRRQRFQHFASRATGAEGGESQTAEVRFLDQERRGLLAKCRTWRTLDFESVRVIGEGAFGLVHLVRQRGSGKLYALKQMEKARYQRKNRDRAFAERNVLKEARNRWCVELYATFQDAEHVYMAMEFVQGGDLIAHLARKGRFTADETAFYMAELLEALDTVHQCGFAHRDVKPDNVVIGRAGHIKLLDFGLCKSDLPGADESPRRSAEAQAPQARTARARAKSVVGTPQYMAPEAYMGKCGADADIWSVGIIAFECLAGVVPFHAGRMEGAEAIKVIRQKVEKHAEVLAERLQKTRDRGFTDAVSEQFLTRVICVQEKRLSVEQCRREPFFAGLDFAQLHLLTPPFVPEGLAPDDTSYFDAFEPRALPTTGDVSATEAFLEWAHYNFDREAHDLQRPDLDVDALFHRAK